MPSDAAPVIIHIDSGKGNYISSNYTAASAKTMQEPAVESASCFSMQVEALLTAEESKTVAVTTVCVEQKSQQNIVLDSGSAAEVVIDKKANAFKAIPVPEIVQALE